ncbi:zinc-ribbon domain-containing protein [Desulfosporosinus metallidurans]|uniref:zinc-ribbon domain-containing protein n=1 Tax=Desulfosporosinus metallidurans TaxID=1888891 RepID=UPI0009FB013C|nr:zinc ribbon domain-containing protein [Desulfosporosinus metallidurans]
MFCPNCGTKLAEDHGFCQNCGTRVQDAYLEGPGEMPQNLTGGPAQATGGLKVWLWLMIVGGLIGVIASIVYGIYYLKMAETFRVQSALQSNLGSQYSRIATKLFVYVPINIVNILGAFRLLKGYKHGFYIVCICAGVAFFINIFSGSWLASFFGLASPVIVWLLVRKQWECFQ